MKDVMTPKKRLVRLATHRHAFHISIEELVCVCGGIKHSTKRDSGVRCNSNIRQMTKLEREQEKGKRERERESSI